MNVGTIFKALAGKRQKDAQGVQERFILSIDGGGIRGIVPAVVLARLSDHLKSLGDDKPLYSHFDLVAGTSTGALLSLGLTLCDIGLANEEGPAIPVTEDFKSGFFKHGTRTIGYIKRAADPQLFAKLYLDNAAGIFSPKMRLLGPVFGSRYDSASLEDVLDKTYKDAKLSDCLVPTMLVSYDSREGQGVMLSSYNQWKDMAASQAARASAAAPLYFQPLHTVSPEGREVSLLDGGMIANDPALLAYAEARRLYPDCRRFHLLSLSTARPPYRFNPKEAPGGIAGWAEPVMRIYPNAQYSLTHMVLSSLEDVSLTRAYSQVTKEKIKLDDTRPGSLKLLLEGGNKMWEDNKEALTAYASLLSQREDFTQVALAPAEEVSLIEGT